MPHLSPMHWIFTLFSFFLTLSFLLSLIWWYQTPKFYFTSQYFNTPSRMWKW